MCHNRTPSYFTSPRKKLNKGNWQLARANTKHGNAPCKSACVRTYCQCTPGVLYWQESYAEHVANAAIDDLLDT